MRLKIDPTSPNGVSPVSESISYVSTSTSGGTGTSDHAELTNLDYASSGHTGFQPAGTYLTDISGQDLSTADNTTSAFITASDIPAIPADVSELTDTTGIIPDDVSDLTDTTGIIPTDLSDITDTTGIIPTSVDDLAPSQTGNSGKFLGTDGTNATWTAIPGGGDMLASVYDAAGGAKQVAFSADLGSAALADTGDFATAAQGGLANTALQAETDPVYSASEAASFVAGDAAKLAGIEAGAEVNVQSDWTQTTTSSDDYIKNKPDITIPNKYVEGVPLYVIGHSYTIYPYPYATQYTGEYPIRIRNRLKMSDVYPIGRSGTIAADNFGRMISTSYDSGNARWVEGSKGVCIIHNTINELGSSQAGDSDYRTLWADSIRGEIATFNATAIKSYADRSAVSGTWTAGAQSRDTKGIDGTTYFSAYNSGAYIEWAVSGGDEVWVVGVAAKTAYPVGKLDVICNGTTLDTLDGNSLKPSYTDTVLAADLDYTPHAWKVTGLNAAAGTTGAKTVRVKVAGTSGNCFISGIIEPATNPPAIFLAKEPPRAGSAAQTYLDNIAWYNAMTDTIAAEFSNVYAVDLSTGWDNDTMVSSLDTVHEFHPNDIGMELIAEHFTTAINTNITDWVDGVSVL